jgi:hypothetical protein
MRGKDLTSLVRSASFRTEVKDVVAMFAQVLCIVLLQVGEVAGKQQRFVHRLIHIQPQMEHLWIDRQFAPKDIRLKMNLMLIQQHCTLCRPILIVPSALMIGSKLRAKGPE